MNSMPVATPSPKRRRGSRLLLALALAAGTLAALYAGSRAADAAIALLGLTSMTGALIVKVAAFLAALPIGFYAVEWLFLRMTSRGDAGDG